VHFTSEAERREAAEVVRIRQPIILPNPVDTEPAATKLPSGWLRTRYSGIGDRKVVLFLSRLDPKKGLDLLLEACALLQKQGQHAVLVLCGDGDKSFVAGLRQAIEAWEIQDSVVWTGFLDTPEKYAALRDADVFALPSYSENFGVSVVEAMSQGSPVIVSDQVALHREIAEGGAGLVVPCAVHELQQALQMLLTQTEQRQTMGRNGKRLAAQFSPAAVADRLVTVYQDLVSRGTQLGERIAC
jgi:glycosyltransferase involved in cell wall biosynthesis